MRTIRSSREIDGLFSNATKTSHPLLMLLTSPAADAAGGRVCFVAGRRLGGAVVRNRMKRLLREAVIRSGGLPQSHDIVFIARAGLADATPAEIDAALESVLRRAGAV